MEDLQTVRIEKAGTDYLNFIKNTSNTIVLQINSGLESKGHDTVNEVRIESVKANFELDAIEYLIRGDKTLPGLYSILADVAYYIALFSPVNFAFATIKALFDIPNMTSDQILTELFKEIRNNITIGPMYLYDWLTDKFGSIPQISEEKFKNDLSQIVGDLFFTDCINGGGDPTLCQNKKDEIEQKTKQGFDDATRPWYQDIQDYFDKMFQGFKDGFTALFGVVKDVLNIALGVFVVGGVIILLSSLRGGK